jgi:hypothetical protein
MRYRLCRSAIHRTVRTARQLKAASTMRTVRHLVFYKLRRSNLEPGTCCEIERLYDALHHTRLYVRMSYIVIGNKRPCWMITRFHWHAQWGGRNLIPLQGSQKSYRVKNDHIRALRVLNSLLKTIEKINLLILIAFIQILIPPIVNRGEGLEAGGVAKLCYCSLSRDNTGASKSI